jgi:hypothetical protein
VTGGSFFPPDHNYHGCRRWRRSSTPRVYIGAHNMAAAARWVGPLSLFTNFLLCTRNQAAAAAAADHNNPIRAPSFSCLLFFTVLSLSLTTGFLNILDSWSRSGLSVLGSWSPSQLQESFLACVCNSLFLGSRSLL